MEFTDIPLSAITVSDFNARKDLSAGTEDAGIRELADSIRDRGPAESDHCASPRGWWFRTDRRPDGGFLACQQLEMASIPAIVREDLDDTDATVISLVENVHRADMSPVDKARAYQRIHERYGSYAEVGRQTGVSPQTVKKYLSLLALHPEIQESISTAQGPVGVAAMSAKLADTFSPGAAGAGARRDRWVQARHPDRDPQVERRQDRASSRNSVSGPLNGAFDTRLCRDGLCFVMPDDLKSIIRALAEDHPGDFEATIRSLAAARPSSDQDGGRS